MNNMNIQPAKKISTFQEFARRANYGVCLNLQDHVIATHREFAILRQCANTLSEKPGQVIHIFSPGNMARTKYLVKTLMHLGVSCSQINVDLLNYNENTPNGMWLLITDAGTKLAA